MKLCFNIFGVSNENFICVMVRYVDFLVFVRSCHQMETIFNIMIFHASSFSDIKTEMAIRCTLS